jgi:FdhE protein
MDCLPPAVFFRTQTANKLMAKGKSMLPTNSLTEFTPETVRQAAEGILAARPAYRELITFYGRIFAAQEEARSRLCLEPIQLTEELIRIKRREHLPLIMASEMVFDPQVSGDLFKEIGRVAIDCGSELAEAARRLSDRVQNATALFGPFLKAQESVVIAGAEELGVEPKSLAFFLYHSLRPSLCGCAAQLAGYLDPLPSGEQGYCPVCGSAPAIAWIEGEGQRHLFCSFCWQKWPLNRTLCPFCGSRDQQGLLYFYSDEEKEYRFDACESCRKYIKTVDTRVLSRRAYPPLEQVASLHLDLKAAESGYTAGLPAHPPA